MHVLLVIEATNGGAARHVIDLARGLADSDIDVSVAYSPNRADQQFTEAIEDLSSRIRGFAIPMTRKPGPGDIRAWRHLRQTLDRHGPFDIIHGHSAKGGALARLAALGHRCRAIYTPHAFITMDPTLTGISGRLYRVAEGILGLLADRIICVSDDEYRHAIALGIHPDRLVTVLNGIGMPPSQVREEARDEMQLEDGQVCIGFVGRLSAQKAVDRLIRCFAPIGKRAPEARLAIVGDGPDRSSLETLIDNLELGNKVRMLGTRDGPRMMSGFDVFALSSNYEAMPYVLIEAAATGLPIISTRVGGAGTVIDDGRNGYIVPINDDSKLSERLYELVSDASLRARMAEESAHVAAEFGIERMVDETIALYRECAAEINQ